MRSDGREEIDAVFDALDADLDRVCALSFDALTTPELVDVLEKRALVVGRLQAVRYELGSPFTRPSGRRT